MKQFGEYFIALDQSGHPLIRKKSWNYFISLFPVSIFQFQRCFQFNLDDFKTNNFLKNFVRSVEKKQLEIYLDFLEKEDTDFQKGQYKIPSKEQWVCLFESSDEISALKTQLELFCSEEPVAKHVIKWIKDDHFPLVKEGILEMIESGNSSKIWFEDTIQCMGKPHYDLWPNTWDPLIVRDLYWWITEADEENGKDEFRFNQVNDNPKGKDLVGFRIIKEIPTLYDRINSVIEEAELMINKNPGQTSLNAVFGADSNPFTKSRFRYLSPLVKEKVIDQDVGFNKNTDIFFLGILLIEAINGYPMMATNDIDHIFGNTPISLTAHSGINISLNESAKEIINDMIINQDNTILEDIPEKLKSLLINIKQN